jgi:hypothetical protein
MTFHVRFLDKRVETTFRGRPLSGRNTMRTNAPGFRLGARPLAVTGLPHVTSFDDRLSASVRAWNPGAAPPSDAAWAKAPSPTSGSTAIEHRTFEWRYKAAPFRNRLRG